MADDNIRPSENLSHNDQVVDSTPQPARAEVDATNPERNTTIRAMEESRTTDGANDPLRSIAPTSASDLLASKDGSDCTIRSGSGGGSSPTDSAAPTSGGDAHAAPRGGGSPTDQSPSSGSGDRGAAPTSQPEATVQLRVQTTVGNDTIHKVQGSAPQPAPEASGSRPPADASPAPGSSGPMEQPGTQPGSRGSAIDAQPPAQSGPQQGDHRPGSAPRPESEAPQSRPINNPHVSSEAAAIAHPHRH